MPSRVLALTLVLVLAVPAAARTWPEIQKDFKSRYASADPAAKAAAMALLAEGDCKAACELLGQVVALHETELAKVLGEIDALNVQLAPLLGRTQFFGDELDRRNRYQAEIEAKQVVRAGHDGVLAAADAALVAMKSDECRTWMLGALAKKPWTLQVAVARALGSLKAPPPAAIDGLIATLKDKEPRVVAACIDALAAAQAAKAADAIALALEHKTWQVRAAAVVALRTLGTTAHLGALIARLGKEDGRLEEDLNATLVRLAGVNHRGNAAVWKAWYEANKGELANRAPVSEADAQKLLRETDEGGSTSITFYGIKTKSKRIAFVIDRSDSMKTPAGEQPKEEDKPEEKPGAGVTLTGQDKPETPPVEGQPKPIPGQPTPPEQMHKALAGITGNRKIDVAKRELIKAVAGLDAKTMFTIIWYNEGVQPWKTSLVLATNEGKDLAIAEIAKLDHQGATNIFDAVEQAFALSGFGKRDDNYASGVDTIFLLSDGAPNKGRFTAPEDILREVGKMNAERKLTIHTIGIGPEHNEDLMRRLAEDNGGEYVARR